MKIPRRAVLGLLLAAPLAARAADRGLKFVVFRNGAKVGEQAMTFAGDAQAMTVTSDVAMTVRIGPVPVYRYRHHAVERWTAGRFAALDTTTNGNGKRQHVSARPGPGGLAIETERGRIVAPADALPFTHWNTAAFQGPMFNPQEGKLLKVTATRRGRETVRRADGRSLEATVWSVRGEAEIDDYYDADGGWVALRGKLSDGSTMEYRQA